MKLKTNRYTLLIALGILLIISHVLGYWMGDLFYYCIKPFLYIILAICVWFLIPKRKLIYHDSKEVNIFLILGAFIVQLLLFGMGIFFGFSHNPLQFTWDKLLLNFFYFIVIVVAQEFIRIRMLNAISKTESKYYIFFLSILLALGYCNLNSYIHSNLGMVIVRTYEQLLPNIVISLMLSYAIWCGARIGVYLYMLLPKMIQMFFPILPNIPWIVTSLMTITIPIFLYYMIGRLEQPTLKEKQMKVVSCIRFAVWFLLIFSVLFVNRIFNVYPLAIASNSMVPTFSKGDVVFLQRNKNQQYKVGDIIQFPTKDNTTYIHRVVKILKKDHRVYYVTQGDNNNSIDLVPVESNQVNGKVIGVVKYIGYPTVWLYEQLNESI